MMFVIHPIFFAFFYGIKGGSHWRIPGLQSLDHGVLGFLLDGTRLSSILAGIYIGIHTDFHTGLAFGFAWFLGVCMSMGEEAGAIGTYFRSWGPYLKWMPETRFFKIFCWKLGISEGEIFGWKKAFQRYVFLGALLALATGYTGFIISAASAPLFHWVGQSIYYRLTRKDSWVLAEPMIGTAIGIAAFYYLETP